MPHRQIDGLPGKKEKVPSLEAGAICLHTAVFVMDCYRALKSVQGGAVSYATYGTASRTAAMMSVYTLLFT